MLVLPKKIENQYLRMIFERIFFTYASYEFPTTLYRGHQDFSYHVVITLQVHGVDWAFTEPLQIGHVKTRILVRLVGIRTTFTDDIFKIWVRKQLKSQSLTPFLQNYKPVCDKRKKLPKRVPFKMLKLGVNASPLLEFPRLDFCPKILKIGLLKLCEFVAAQAGNGDIRQDGLKIECLSPLFQGDFRDEEGFYGGHSQLRNAFNQIGLHQFGGF